MERRLKTITPVAYVLPSQALVVCTQITWCHNEIHTKSDLKADKLVQAQYFLHQTWSSNTRLTVKLKIKHGVSLLPAGDWGQDIVRLLSWRISPEARPAPWKLGCKYWHLEFITSHYLPESENQRKNLLWGIYASLREVAGGSQPRINT